MASFHKSGLDQILRRPEQESNWRRLVRDPVRYLAGALYSLFQSKAPATVSTGIRIVCISDTHNNQPALPDGDVLIHAGDLTQSGSLKELNAQIAWLDAQPHRYKVVIAGNHELCLDRSKGTNRTASQDGADHPESIDWRSLTYLQQTSAILQFGSRALRIFGSPYTPKHGNWAFEYQRTGPDPWEGNIPEDTDILVTHGPPKTHLDLGHMGCHYLLRALWSMKRRPLLHVCGHIHGGYGQEALRWDSFQKTYERVMAERAGWSGLVKMIHHGLKRLLSSCGDRTILVNAAIVGGVRDEKRREPIIVTV